MDDPILYWNAIALEANRITHSVNGPQTGPTMSSRALAIIHLAMHDAYRGVKGGDSYLKSLPPRPGTNEHAAVAAAACTTLAALYPDRRLDFEAAVKDAAIPSKGADQSAEFGRKVAECILDRLAIPADQPGAGDTGYVGAFARGCHRPDPDNPGQKYHAPFYGATARLIAVTKRHGLKSPAGWLDPSDQGYEKDLAAPAYLDALEEVVRLGGQEGRPTTKRTPSETLAGIYWAYDGANQIGTPPRLYNQMVRVIAANKNNKPADNARLFALVNAAMADAGILAWSEKYRHNLWRPVLGVREHDASMGPTAAPGAANPVAGDPFWLPLGSPRSNTSMKSFTPPFPAYPSGHATFGAAAFQVVRRHYKVGTDKSGADVPDDIAFDFVSDELNGATTDQQGVVRTRHERHFDSLWQAIFENGVSRVYLGVHWVFDAFDAADVRKKSSMEFKDPKDIRYNRDPDHLVGGVPLGLAIADDTFGHLQESEVPALPGPCGDKGEARRKTIDLKATNIR